MALFFFPGLFILIDGSPISSFLTQSVLTHIQPISTFAWEAHPTSPALRLALLGPVQTFPDRGAMERARIGLPVLFLFALIWWPFFAHHSERANYWRKFLVPRAALGVPCLP